MRRPDQDRFDQHSRHFELIDDELERFSGEHEFDLVKNMYRTPCRMLVKPGNPHFNLEVYQEDY